MAGYFDLVIANINKLKWLEVLVSKKREGNQTTYFQKVLGDIIARKTVVIGINSTSGLR